VVFSFSDDGSNKTFNLKTSDSEAEPLLTGTWVQTGAKFAVTSNLEAFYDSLMGSLSDLGLGIAINVGNYSGDTFTGTVSQSKNGFSTLIKGKYKLTAYFDNIEDVSDPLIPVVLVDLTGTSLTISGAYEGTLQPDLAVSHTRTVFPEQSKSRELVNSLAQTIRTKILDAVKK
jgi:hypothetical protein